MASPLLCAFETGSGMPAITVSELPKEGRETLALIHKGGPHPYAKDGSIFSNREKALPRKPRGYYHEYTVKTPGARDRGARRIICGGDGRLTCYYTGDHYRSFKIIRE
ncbi:MAG: ribonuclease domain-containing protein [Betaproteobacteria bacterium]